jgi:hypothetical protein
MDAISPIRGVGTATGRTLVFLSSPSARREAQAPPELTADTGFKALRLIQSAVALNPIPEEYRLDVQA